MPADSSSTLKHITAILDCFSTTQPELGVREVARLTNLSPSTAGRLMTGLKEYGLLQQNPATRAYALGYKVLEWAGVFTAVLDLRNIALPFMEDLHQATGETISLYQRDGDERLCVERLESHQTVRMVSRLGRRLPLAAGSGGKAILAFLPAETAEPILGRGELKAYTANTIVNRQQLLDELARIRRQGCAVSLGEWLADAAGVAAPIFGRDGEVIGSLSISCPTSRLTPEKVEQYAAQLLRATEQISIQMGCSGAMLAARKGGT